MNQYKEMSNVTSVERTAEDASQKDRLEFVSCALCQHEFVLNGSDCASIRGNTARFKHETFRVWKCPRCRTLRALEPVDFQDIYTDYPLNKRRLDGFAKGSFKNVLRRLRKMGLKKNDAILDYGCGHGLFVRFMQEQGFTGIRGYDPYHPEFDKAPEVGTFEFLVSNDVIEHCEDPRAFVQDCTTFLKPKGLLYLGTPDADDIELDNPEPHLMRLHLPFHRTILTREGLHGLVEEFGFRVVGSWRRSYMDTLRPFTNFRFIEEVNCSLGHDLGRALDPSVLGEVIRRPRLIFFGLFGWLFPSAYEPSVAARRLDS